MGPVLDIRRIPVRTASVGAAIALLAACATPPPPPPPPPAPPPVEVVPYRPLPPNGASYMMDIPPVGPDGLRRTVNSSLDADTTLWHFRSVWNVAALNCVKPEDEPILTNYGTFLRDNSKALAAANASIDKVYRSNYPGKNAGVKAREAQMTSVYNYFALPPVRQGLCNTALAIANEYAAAKPTDINAFAAAGLSRFEGQYQQFFTAYDQYVADSSAWDARYGDLYGSSQPGYVAVHATRGRTIGTSLAAQQNTPAAGGVVDPQTGAIIPVIKLPEDQAAVPIVQPVAKGK